MNEAEVKPAAVPPRWVVALAMRLRHLLRGAADAVVPAPVAMFERTTAYMQTHLLRAAANLRLADRLAAGPRSAAELAAEAGVEAAALGRLLRGLATLGVFALQGNGRFANNRASLVLRADAEISLRDAALYFGSSSQLRAWERLEEALAGADAFVRANGVDTWEWFERHAAEREAFAGTMVGMTRLFAAGVAKTYPFEQVQRLCDVGGGHGDLLAAILIRHAHLDAVLLDSPGVLATAKPFLEGRRVAARVTLAPGSFFEGVPAGCDTYLLKNILHDWDDARTAVILANCRRAMQPGHRLLIVEAIVEPDSHRDMGPLADLQMLVVCSGGRERGHAEYRALLERSAFRLVRVLPTPGPMSILEAFAV